jgi:hypothetical protein
MQDSTCHLVFEDLSLWNHFLYYKAPRRQRLILAPPILNKISSHSGATDRTFRLPNRDSDGSIRKRRAVRGMDSPCMMESRGVIHLGDCRPSIVARSAHRFSEEASARARGTFAQSPIRPAGEGPNRNAPRRGVLAVSQTSIPKPAEKRARPRPPAPQRSPARECAAGPGAVPGGIRFR